MNKERILTGDRPTGRLHLGHYFGSLKNRINAQDDYDCFFIIADLHTLTTKYKREHISMLDNNIFQTVLDYLAVGIDPNKSTIFVQSEITEIFELNTLLGMLANVPRLQRVPSLKEMAVSANLKVIPFGLLGYPVLMAADILLPRANLVPIGSDNIPNVEVARELARRFNSLYNSIFPIPKPLKEKTLVGIDGNNKMSKSLNNAIYLSDNAKTVEIKVMRIFTDPNRLTADTPGRVEGNPVFIYHEAFNPDTDFVEDLKNRYRTGSVGDIEVKKTLALVINDTLEPIRKHRKEYEKQPSYVNEIIRKGNNRMKVEAHETIRLVREAMGLTNRFYMEVKTNNYIDKHKPTVSM